MISGFLPAQRTRTKAVAEPLVANGRVDAHRRQDAGECRMFAVNHVVDGVCIALGSLAGTDER
jgi:hypothetical protein